MRAKREIDVLERVRIGGMDQWVLLRGRAADAPVLLLLQAGPGFPLISEAEEMERLLGLEEHFVVAYWDQRGSGKSCPAPLESMTCNRLVSDAAEMFAAMRERTPAHEVFVAGFSFGATVAALAAARAPCGEIQALVAVGIDIDFAESERVAYAFAVEEATRTAHRRARRELAAIGPPPHLTSKSFFTRVKWVTQFGGIHRRERYVSLARKTLWRMLRSSHYRLLDVVRAIRWMLLSQERLLPEEATLDLTVLATQLSVATFLFQGRHDRVAPAGPVERFFDALPMGAKELVWFEDSAHLPHYEEPQRFRTEMLRVLASNRRMAASRRQA